MDLLKVKTLKQDIKHLLTYLPVFKHIIRTSRTAAPITLKTWFIQKVLGFNKKAYWPVHFTSFISSPQNIFIGVGSAPGLSPGCYIQGGGKIYIGDYTLVAPNVGIISANHDVYNNSQHIKSEVRIGNYCWIGMNAVILPNVHLGDFCVVAAGSIVTKSFSAYSVVAGNPARLIRTLEADKCLRFENEYKYHGYLTEKQYQRRLNC